MPWVLAQLGCERRGPLTGVDLGQVPYSALGFGDDLVGNDEQVGVLEFADR